MGKQWKQLQTLFLGASKSLKMVTAAVKLRLLPLGGKAMTNLDRGANTILGINTKGNGMYPRDCDQSLKIKFNSEQP